MSPLRQLSSVVGNALETRQIGTPVAVRLVALLNSDHGRVEPLLAEALEAVTHWISVPPARLMAAGSIASGHVTVQLCFTGGQTALVTAGSCGVGAPVLEVIVVGTRGTMCLEGSDWFSGPDHDELPVTDTARRLSEAVGESLRGGHAVSLAKEGGAASRTSNHVPQSATRVDSTVASVASRNPTPRKPPFGVLLVAGDHTHQPSYAAAFAANDRCRIVGLADESDITPRRRELNEQFAKRMRIPVLPDLDEAFARNDVHIVSICAEPRRRSRIVVEAARAGKHLYLDKPLAPSVADADAIAAAVAKAGVVHQMFSQARSNTARRLRQYLDSGLLGELTAIHCDLSFAKGHGGTAALDKPRRESDQPGEIELPDSKREFSNIGVYPLALIFWLLRRPARRVHAATGNYFFAENQQNDMEDFGQAVVELEGGIVATVSAGRTGWRSHPGGGVNRIVLVGTQRTAVVDAYRPRIEIYADVEPWTAPPRNPEDPMGMWGGSAPAKYTARPKQSWVPLGDDATSSDVAYFLDCIEQGRASDVSVIEAHRANEVLMGAYRSAASGEVVSLPLG